MVFCVSIFLFGAVKPRTSVLPSVCVSVCVSVPPLRKFLKKFLKDGTFALELSFKFPVVSHEPESKSSRKFRNLGINFPKVPELRYYRVKNKDILSKVPELRYYRVKNKDNVR